MVHGSADVMANEGVSEGVNKECAEFLEQHALAQHIHIRYQREYHQRVPANNPRFRYSFMNDLCGVIAAFFRSIWATAATKTLNSASA